MSCMEIITLYFAIWQLFHTGHFFSLRLLMLGFIFLALQCWGNIVRGVATFNSFSSGLAEPQLDSGCFAFASPLFIEYPRCFQVIFEHLNANPCGLRLVAIRGALFFKIIASHRQGKCCAAVRAADKLSQFFAAFRINAEYCTEQRTARTRPSPNAPCRWAPWCRGGGLGCSGFGVSGAIPYKWLFALFFAI